MEILVHDLLTPDEWARALSASAEADALSRALKTVTERLEALEKGARKPPRYPQVVEPWWTQEKG